ncbi:MAG: hypothetical protein M1831_001493 [Alyxoria varia]|nr:MAG: hypothetical protein M1831_001493 [Alyxoria varia]
MATAATAEEATNNEFIRNEDDEESAADSAVHAENKTSNRPNHTSKRLACLRVLGGSLIFFNIWGYALAFGAFQSFYELSFLKGASSSSLSWIGTVEAFLLITLGMFTGPLYDVGYYRILVALGSALMVLSVMMLSLATKYYQVFLAQGVGLGLGSGMLFIPTLALVGASFTTYRALAMGVVTSGIAVGGVLITIMFEQLIDILDFAWTTRVLGFVSLSTFSVAVPALLVKSEATPGRPRSIIDRAALTDYNFLTFSAAQFFIFLGYLGPFFYIPTFAQLVVHTSRQTSLYLLATAAGSSFFGRLVSAVAGHYVGVMLPWSVCSGVSGFLALCWIAVEGLGGLVGFCVLYGFFSGGLVALPPSIFPTVCPDVRKLGTWFGMSWATSAVASLVGTPIGGALVDAKRVDFTGIQAFSGVTMVVGTVLLVPFWVRVARNERKILI